MGAIMVLGATGFTGRLVVEELERRDTPFWIAGRNRDKLKRMRQKHKHCLGFRIASPSRPTSLINLFDDVSVVINTIGPFIDLGEPVVNAALEQNTHYLDTTGEQSFMLQMLERYDAEARRRERAVICAQAFEYALGDCACALALQQFENQADSAEVFYFQSSGEMSRGTMKSIARVLGQPMKSYKGGRLVDDSPASTTAQIRLPGEEKTSEGMLFPGGETLHVHRYAKVEQVSSYMVTSKHAARLLRGGQPLMMGLLGFKPLQNLVDMGIDLLPYGPEERSRESTNFKIVARVRRGAHEKYCILNGHNPYGITATVAVEGAQRLLDQPARQLGVVSTAMAFDAESFLASQKEHGLTVELRG